VNAFEPVEDVSMTINVTVTPLIASGYYIQGYKIGSHLKENIFKCQKLSTKQSFVCKLVKLPALDTNILPIETQVYQALKESPHESLAAMNELISLGIVDGNNSFIEVIDYYGDTSGWMTLYHYLFKDQGWQTSNSDLFSIIFDSIIEAVAHLFSLGFTHGDIKGKNI
jgi:hypothetical protein